MRCKVCKQDGRLVTSEQFDELTLSVREFKTWSHTAPYPVPVHAFQPEEQCQFCNCECIEIVQGVHYLHGCGGQHQHDHEASPELARVDQ
jgi:hypothetical protein